MGPILLQPSALLCWASAMPLFFREPRPIVPPVDPSLHAVAASSLLTLEERFIWSAGLDSPAPVAESTMVISGLARMCDSRRAMDDLLRSCVHGHANVALVLQYYSREAVRSSRGRLDRLSSAERMQRYSFAECARYLFEAAGNGTGPCRGILVRQWWNIRAQGARGDGRRARVLINSLGHYGFRVRVQTLAVGRAYEWASHWFPRTRLFIRGRVDSLMCAPPTLPAVLEPVLVASNSREDSFTKVRMPGDRYAAMTPDVARVYFRAYRIWLRPSATGFCAAAGGSSLCSPAHVASAAMCMGEQPLGMWLCRPGMGLPGIWGNTSKRLNWRSTVANIERDEFLAEAKRPAAKVATTCPEGCWPDCLPVPTPGRNLCITESWLKRDDRCRRFVHDEFFNGSAPTCHAAFLKARLPNGAVNERAGRHHCALREIKRVYEEAGLRIPRLERPSPGLAPGGDALSIFRRPRRKPRP